MNTIGDFRRHIGYIMYTFSSQLNYCCVYTETDSINGMNLARTQIET